jgi:enamine deaminase RidA (YjgF/YER057c/UK114 family)
MSTATPQPAAGSAALMTTTSMTPQSTLLYQGGNLNQQYSSDAYNQVQASLQQYGALRDQYVQMINTALREQDSAKRKAMMPQITAANQQLVALVTQIQNVYNRGQSVLSAQPTNDLQAALDRYKEQLEELRTDEDELVRLNRFYDDMKSTSVIPQTTYYGWIILVLILLFVVFGLFVASAFRSPLQSMLPAMPELPTMSSLGLASESSSMVPSLPSLPSLQ